VREHLAHASALVTSADRRAAAILDDLKVPASVRAALWARGTWRRLELATSRTVVGYGHYVRHGVQTGSHYWAGSRPCFLKLCATAGVVRNSISALPAVGSLASL
jgi:hypothetical protein